MNTKLIQLVLSCAKSKLNQAISKANTKAGNIELKIDVQSAFQAKLGRVNRKLSNLIFLS